MEIIEESNESTLKTTNDAQKIQLTKQRQIYGLRKSMTEIIQSVENLNRKIQMLEKGGEL